MGASSSDIRAGRAYVEMFVDQTGAKAGLKQFGQELQAWGAKITAIGKTFAAAGGAIRAALGAALAVFTKMGSETQELSDRTGISAEALSTLGFAADQTGTDMSSVTSAVAALGKNLAGNDAAAASAADALAQLGLSADQLRRMSPADAFRAVTDRLSRVADPALRAAGALKIFGDSGSGLRGMLAAGAGAVGDLENRARSLGLEMRGSDTSAALELKRALAELWATVKMVSYYIGAPLAEGMTELVKMATPLVGAVVKWVRENRALILSASTLGSILSGIGTALLALGALVSGAGIVLAEFTAIMGAILSPVALVVAAVAGLGYYIVRYTNVGAVAIDWLKGKFNELKGDATAAWEGISAALQAGDFGAAALVAWTAIKLEWAKGTQFLKEKWLEFKFAAIEIAIGLAAAIASSFSDAFAAIEKLWNGMLGKFKSGLQKILGAALRAGVPVPSAAIAAVNAIPVGSNADADAANEKRKQDIADRAAKASDDTAAARQKAQEDLSDAVPRAQKDFDDAVAAALGLKKKKPGPGDQVPNFGAGLDASRNASRAVAGAIGGEDVRSKEGFKAIASLFRGGKDPQEQLVAQGQAQARLQQRQFLEQQKTRQATEKITVGQFA